MKKILAILLISFSCGAFAQEPILLGLRSNGVTAGMKRYAAPLYAQYPLYALNDSTWSFDRGYLKFSDFFSGNGRFNYIPVQYLSFNKNKSAILDFNGKQFVTQMDSTWNDTAFVYVESNSTGLGNGALANSKGVINAGVGYQAFSNGKGDYNAAFGGLAMASYIGYRGTATGYSAGLLARGNDNTYSGYFNSYLNSSNYFSSYGTYGGAFNTSDYSSAFGAFASEYSKAAPLSVAVGYASEQYNLGIGCVGMGANTLQYSNWPYRAAIGHFAGNDSFVVASTKTFASANIIDSNIVITGHGFGTAGTFVNLKYLTTGGTAPSVLTTGTVYLFSIKSADTLTLIYPTLTNTGSGTFSLSKDVDQSYSVAIGYKAWNSRDKEIVLGQYGFNKVVRAYGNMIVDSFQLTTGAGASKVLTSDVNGRGTWQTPAAPITLANPTASIGLTNVNGSASTAMRSDAAPALSQSITPTWTGLHIFRKTTTPVQIGYDASNYMTITPASDATTTFDLTAGSGTPAFIFKKNMLVGAGGPTPSVNLVVDGASQIEAQRFTFTSDRNYYHSIIPSYSGTSANSYLSFMVNNGVSGTQIEAMRMKGNGTVTLPNLSTTGIVHNSSAGALSTSLVSLTADVTGLLPDANISSAATWNGKYSSSGGTITGNVLLSGQADFRPTSSTSVYGLQILSSASLASNKVFRIGVIGLTNGFGMSQDASSNIQYTFENGSVGIGTITPTSTLQITGSFATAYTSKATSYTATSSDYTIEVTATGQTITLPTAIGIQGRLYVIKLTAAGSCTIATTSSQTIDGSTTYSGLSAQYKYVEVQSNNANWIIIANN